MSWEFCGSFVNEKDYKIFKMDNFVKFRQQIIEFNLVKENFS